MNPQVLKLFMDSLRYWVTEMHVDGFRFDLAATLARELHDVSKLSAFFDTIHQDPVLADVKLIAEPWDVGDGGYQVGNFPVLWAEWNGKYRDTVRRFWKGDEASSQTSPTASPAPPTFISSTVASPTPASTSSPRTTASPSPIWSATTRSTTRPTAKTTRTAPTTTTPGIWGPKVQPTTKASTTLRERQTRNFLATLMLSQGVPMLCGGDEVARSQRGNNNAFCQDNELTWYDWNLDPPRKRLMDFTGKLIQLRRAHPNLHRRKFFQDRQIRGSVVRDIAWFNTNGEEFGDENWTTDLESLAQRHVQRQDARIRLR